MGIIDCWFRVFACCFRLFLVVGYHATTCLALDMLLFQQKGNSDEDSDDGESIASCDAVNCATPLMVECQCNRKDRHVLLVFILSSFSFPQIGCMLAVDCSWLPYGIRVGY